MLNSILKRLNGHGSEAESLEAALAQVDRDRTLARDELATLQRERHQALLDDAADSVLDKLERAIDRKQVQLEKFAVAEQPLKDRIAAARREAKQRSWDAHLKAFHANATRFEAAAREALAANSALLDVIAAAQADGFASAVALQMPKPPNIQTSDRNGSLLISIDTVNLFTRAITRAITPPSAPRASKRREPSAPTVSRPATPATVQAKPKPVAKPLAHDNSPLIPGQARARVLLPGTCFADNLPACRAGETIVLPAAIAAAALQRGAVEIIERVPNVREIP